MTNKTTIRAVLIDLSGTIHIGNEAIPGARQALQRLRQSGRRLKFLTNTSTKSSSQLLKQLNDTLHFGIAKEELVTSVLATASYVEKHNLHPLCLMEDTSDLAAGNAKGRQEEQKSDYDSVVVGLASSQFHYQRLNQAFRILLDHPDNLIAIHRGNYYKDPADHGLSLGPGAFVAALETASNCSPAKVMGKPSKTFFDSALWEDVPPEETCMIGDDVLGDCRGAQHAGIGTTILVQTGKYRPGDETKLTVTAANNNKNNGEGGDDEKRKEPCPRGNFLVCPSIVEAVDFILGSSL
mmetsp:Transcript_2135/g.3850  ORF Transcript_2135/g.3850 Transcript_2135/m.3850 type:complete len:295 (-) Transcript_2135:5092-5976(-)